MSRPVVWALSAQADIAETIRFLAEEEPNYVDRVLARIDVAGARLGVAQTGRPGRVGGLYEKSLPDIKFIIAYTFDRSDPNGPVNIVRVIHTSRNWLPGTMPD
jgi:toxin ParE1/3/4